MNTLQEESNLVPLVLQSKRALQHGQQICSHAHVQSSASAKVAINLLALDAKVRWMSEAVVEQLKLAASVAKCIEEKRTQLRNQIKSWDFTCSQATDQLDMFLESLNSRLIPPELHENPSASSLFGSQHSDEGKSEQDESVTVNGKIKDPPSPSVTAQLHSSVINGHKIGTSDQSSQKDRMHWKNLRDFVDDSRIEEILETVENGRTVIDDLLAQTEDYPEKLNQAIASIRASLPVGDPGPSLASRVQDAIMAQDAVGTSMASLLESLAAHYEQIDTALRDIEAGETFTQEEHQQMQRDVEELPAILTELEESAQTIDTHHHFLFSTNNSLGGDLVHLNGILDDLEDLGDIMGEMLNTQEEVELRCNEEIQLLQEHLLNVRDLHSYCVRFQASYDRLVLEMDRRTKYKAELENIVNGMMSQLATMTEQENQVRLRFNQEYGIHLPDDILWCVESPPTKWEVVPQPGEVPEVLPRIDDDILEEAQRNVGNVEN